MHRLAQSDHSEADQEQEVRLQVEEMDTPDNEDEEEVDNKAKLIESTSNQQQQQRPQQQLKLPNFLSSPIDNFANYLGSAPAEVVAPRSRSADRKPDKARTKGGAWAWARTHSLDRERSVETPIISFLSSRSPMSMGAVCQVADPYQQGVQLNGAAPNAEADQGQAEEDSIASKDADCLIG